MTEATIKERAKQIAGEFYESRRSEAFRKGEHLVKSRRIVKDERTGLPREVIIGVPFKNAFPTADAFVEAWWPFWIEEAERQLTTMLALDRVPEVMKERIYDAVIEQREKQLKIEAGILPGSVRRLIQRNLQSDG